MPMIPLGLKETKEVNFLEPFSDFILEHYSEESDMYQDAIADITDTRQVEIKINLLSTYKIILMENFAWEQLDIKRVANVDLKTKFY